MAPTTSFQPQDLLRPEVSAMEEYTPIQPFEVLSKRLGMPASQIVKLDANENPYGPVPAVAEALAEYAYYHIYPDPQQADLRDALSEYVGLSPEHILPGHGADELLDYLCRLFLSSVDSVINCPPTFGMYSFDAGLVGARVIDVWRREDYSIDVEGIERVIGDWGVEPQGETQSPIPNHQSPPPKILFLTSPNNPSGNWLSDQDLARLLKLPLLVVLDEAYVEFADHQSRASWVLDHENLVVLRTFSKAAGIAGLRLGYGICPGWLMEQLWKFKQPYNVNVAAMVAGLASLRSVDDIRVVIGLLKAERRRLYRALDAIPYLEPFPSQSNFILCSVVGRSAAELKQALERQGILVRFYSKPRLENSIRISVGRSDQTDRLLDVLRTL